MAPSPVPIQFEHVWKRYRIGSKHDSLRDAIPSLLRRLTGGNGYAVGEGEFWALRDVSFGVRPGEMLGIIGPNGAGKSTILKLLSRICKQTAGTIAVRGRVAALIEVGAGFHPDLTGRENIYLNGTIMGLRRRRIDRLFDSIVELSGLEQFLDMPVKRYSSGMTVRLGFAVAAHVDPDVLLIDEVLAVGDLAFQQRCYQRILDLKARGTTSLFISHNLEAVQRLCDRVLVLQTGHVLRDGDPAEQILAYRQDVMRHQRAQLLTPSGPQALKAPRDLEVVSAVLLDGRGRPGDAFQTGQPVSLHLRYLARRPIRDPSVSVAIERMDGLLCHEALSKVSGMTWGPWDGSGVVVLRYPTLNLLPNTYQVNVAIYEDTIPTPLVHLRGHLYFHITSQVQTRGAVRLDHDWQVEPAVAPSCEGDAAGSPTR